MNKGIKLSTGEVLFFLNAGDEFIDSSVVSDFMMQFNKEEKISMVFGDINIVNESLGITYRKEQKYISWRYLMMDYICHQSIFFSRDAIVSLGMYDTQYRICVILICFLRY
jgi:glycosyltransferase